MPYVRSKRNVRRPRRRRASVRRRYTRRSTRSRTPRRGMNRQKACRCPGELSPSAKFALAQIDPFEPVCLGAKVPDTNTMPSIANADTDQLSLAGPSAAGNLIAICFNPSYTSATQAATDGAASVTWSTTFAARRNQSNILTNIEAYRPVAHAVRIISPLAPTAATGFVHIGLSTESRYGSATVPQYPKTVNEMTGLAHYKRVTLASLTQTPLTVINKWIDETAFRYDAPESAYDFTAGGSAARVTTFNFQQSWATIIVMVEGQATTTVSPISFEHLLLSEMLPAKTSFLLGTSAAPNSPGTMSAVSAMQSETDAMHTEAEQESYIQRGVDAFSRGAQTAGADVFNNVAEPLLERFGRYAVSAGMAYALNASRGTGGIPGVNSNPNRLALT
ncbi:MAG: capsid protein [Cressdnaviricota sp.]|nr:MAG: capsid protein [Cressdnaviricota sp.]